MSRCGLHLRRSIPPIPIQRTGLESRNLFNLMFDTLVSLDEQGKLQPALASSWQAEAGNQRWQFFLRRGVTFQDGTPVTAGRSRCFTAKDESNLEGILRRRGCRRSNVTSPAPNLPAELSLPRNSIVKRDGGKISGQRTICCLPLGAGEEDFRSPLATTIGTVARFWMRLKLRWGRVFASR